ncbi:DUF4350 domain-containing protein [Microbacterium sp.]|uniref:DUF4350 domain-containing protein n=1 Tax=Microbacterium sp. TaxID=51671 RepID=UPI00281102A7|nr:DUF4350 domain-containing protein [Microbacterium sp.]
MTVTTAPPPTGAGGPSPEPTAESTAAPRPRGRRGRILGWLLVVVLLLGIAVLSMRFVATAPSLSGPLNPESPSPGGARALAELVRQQGVEVQITRSRADAAASVDGRTTLVLTDPYTLTDDAAVDLLDSAERVVLLTSSSRMLRLLDLGADAPLSAGALDADCTVAEFARTGSIEPERLFDAAPGVEACFRDGSGAAALLRFTDAGRSVSLVEGSRLFSNKDLAQDGNAALGLALLAQTDRVVWYVPSFEDSDITGEQSETLGTLTPDWLTPAIVLLLLAGIAAVCWRARRFGPLVAESLPVTVRASETMHGRAHLTAKAGDSAHAAVAIREGTTLRLSRRLGLSPRASAHEVADSAADRLRVPRGSLHELLAGPSPASDRDLIDLARKLAELETAVDNAFHTERNLP